MAEIGFSQISSLLDDEEEEGEVTGNQGANDSLLLALRIREEEESAIRELRQPEVGRVVNEFRSPYIRQSGINRGNISHSVAILGNARIRDTQRFGQIGLPPAFADRSLKPIYVGIGITRRRFVPDFRTRRIDFRGSLIDYSARFATLEYVIRVIDGTAHNAERG